MEEHNYGKSYLHNDSFEDYSHPFGAFVQDVGPSDNVAYLNASTCPDCGGGMVRLGGCFTCQSCGYGSCSL